MNKPQYTISVNFTSKRRGIVIIKLSGKPLKRFVSTDKSINQLKREAAIYCEKQGWEYGYAKCGVA